MAKKWTKALMGLAFTGAAIGGAIAYKKYVVDSDIDDDFEDDFEEEDYDLDENIAGSSNREYVTLNVPNKNKETEADDENADEEEVSADE
jgi:hypothetical protein